MDTTIPTDSNEYATSGLTDMRATTTGMVLTEIVCVIRSANRNSL